MGGPLQVPLASTAIGGNAPGIRPGQQYVGTVQGSAGNLQVTVGGLKISISANFNEVKPGQQVQVEFVRTGQGLQARIFASAQSETTISLPRGFTLPSAASGQPLSGLIAGKPGNLTLVLGDQRIPLDSNAFASGQRVQVTVDSSTGQLRLSTIATPSTPGGISVPSGSPLNNLPPGQSVAGTIQTNANGTTLLVQGQRIPVSAELASRLPAQGQYETVKTSAGLSLRLSANTVTRESLEPLQATLRGLGPETLRHVAQYIAPREATTQPGALSKLLTLFTTEFVFGNELDDVLAFARSAVDRGVMPKNVFDALIKAAALFRGDAPIEQAADALETAAKQARSTAEGRVAASIAGNTLVDVAAADDDLRSVLNQMRNNAAFREHLQQSGTLSSFDRLSERLMERMTGTHLQNLHAVDQAYVFFEAPVFGDGMKRAQIHIFGDSSSGRNAYSADHATVLMDVSSTTLGELWVQLSSAGGHCVCRFRTESADVANAIDTHAPELQSALTDAGYTTATVEAMQGRVDRLDQLAAGLRRFSGLSVQA